MEERFSQVVKKSGTQLIQNINSNILMNTNTQQTGVNAITPAAVQYPGNVETLVQVHELNRAQMDHHQRQQDAADAANAINIFKLETKTAMTRKVSAAAKAFEDAKADRNKAGEQLNTAVRDYALAVDRKDKTTITMVAAINAFYPDAEMTVNRLLPTAPRLVSRTQQETCTVEEWLVVEGTELRARTSVDTSVSIPAATGNGSSQDGWLREVVLDAKLSKAVREQLERIESVKKLEAEHKAAKQELDQLDQHADLLHARALRMQLDTTPNGAKLLQSIDLATQAAQSGNWLLLEGPATKAAPPALPAPVEAVTKKKGRPSKK